MKVKRIVSIVITVLLILNSYVSAFQPAASAIISKNGSISLHVIDSRTAKPLENAKFRLYFFAAAYEKQDSIGYEYVIPYDDCKMNMGNLDDAYLPVHLANFALTHDLPYTEKSSDENGYIYFDNLKPGVYLILATEIIDAYFLPSPFVINIPLYDHENNSWKYDINATPKMQVSSADKGETTYLSVKKKWDTDELPVEQVTVSLLCNLMEIEKVVLSEENNWYYRWDNLDKSCVWNVVEAEVPDGYTVSYDFSSNSVIITNSKKYVTETTTVPAETTLTEETTTVVTSDTTAATTEPEESTTKPDKLYDTGQLNWPVPFLAIAGLILFSLGWALNNFDKKDEDEV